MKRPNLSVVIGLLASSGLAFADGAGKAAGLADPNEDEEPAKPAQPPASKPALEPLEPAGPPAAAVVVDEGPRAMPMELGVFTGVFVSNYFHQFYDPAKFPAGVMRPNLNSAAPMFGLRFAHFLNPNIGLEGDVSWTLEGPDVGSGSESIIHLGASLMYQIPTLGKVVPHAELGWGAWIATGDLGGAQHFPIHAGVGARVFVSDSIAVRADFRYYRGPADQDPYTLAAGYAEFGVGLAWVPHHAAARTEETTTHVEQPEGDRDGDGIVDSKDKCPDQAEDKDGFQDQDGCPDPDNDGDGIPDASDKCPTQAEDKDGFQDQDGCPDPDNDADGVPDAQDKCPTEPEDKDGFQDADGCPDPDNDHDGIPDASDKCPNEPETINGNQDDDGCPDKGDALVIISPERIDLLEPIKFDKDKLSKKSQNLLGQIGATLRAHPEIIRLRVTAYVQPSKKTDKDQELSDKRAAAVEAWLVAYGIDAKRLQSRGFGGTKPLVPPEQKGSAAFNDRVELIILEKK